MCLPGKDVDPSNLSESFVDDRGARAKREYLHAIASASLVMLTEGFFITMSFPFASFMVQDALEIKSGSEYFGFWTGLFFTSHPVGCLLTSRLWGSLANTYGRKRCLMVSLASGAACTLATAVLQDYYGLLLIRLVQGMTMCSLPMARTYLKERVNQLGADEVQAFSLLQTAFAISSVLGPSAGGYLYGASLQGGVWIWPLGAVRALPWTLPHLIACCLYAVSLLLSWQLMTETGDLSGGCPQRAGGSPEAASIFDDFAIRVILVIVSGHSFIFTGWEVGYPVVARQKHLEDWTAFEIGITFLVGSIVLAFHTLITYPMCVKRFGIRVVWMSSWSVCLVVLLAFPRLLQVLLGRGHENHSLAVLGLNYAAQICISVFQGCNFTTLSLLINVVVSRRDDGDYTLPLANGWAQSLQSLARAASPIVTGSLMKYQTFFHGLLAFDVLCALGFCSCFVPMLFLWKHVREDTAERPGCGEALRAGQGGRFLATAATGVPDSELSALIIDGGLAEVCVPEDASGADYSA